MNILIVHEVDWLKKIIFEPHHLSELFALKGHDVFVVDCREPDIRNLSDGFHTKIIQNYNRVYKEASVTLIRPPSLLIKGLNRLSYFLFYKRIIKKILEEKKIDIVLLYGIATNGIQTIQAAKELGIPIVFRSLDVSHGLVKIPIIWQMVKRCEKYVDRNCDFILTTTPGLSRYVVTMGAKKENVETFDLGINLKVFRPLQKDTTLLRQLGLEDNCRIIVFMGTLYDFAGLDNLISNFHILKNAIENIRLLIIGGGPDLINLRTLVKRKKLDNEIKITGFIPQEDIPKYIALADVCVNPFYINIVTDSILPTKILEYSACGKPVISTPLKGTVELLPNERFGVTYSTTEDFIENMISLLQNEKKMKELGENGYSYVKMNHDWDKLSEKLLQKLKDLSS